MSKSELVVMVGGPAAGKSSVAKAMFRDLPRVDCDEVKSEHPDYDPKKPWTVHEWSAAEALRRLMGYLSRGESVVYDGTGTNGERLAMLVGMARATGMRVTAVLVTCSVDTAVQRNAGRERVVPEAMLREKHAKVAETWPVVRGMVDAYEVVDTEEGR